MERAKSKKLERKDLVLLIMAIVSSFAILSTPKIPNYEEALILTDGSMNSLLTFIVKMRLFIDVNPMLGLCVFLLIFLIPFLYVWGWGQLLYVKNGNKLECE